MARIDGLPPELEDVPPAPASPDADDAPERRAAWLAWRDRVRAYRIERAELCLQSDDLRTVEYDKCRRSPSYFLTVWGWLYEPRAERPGEDEIPFIPFAAQVDLLEFFDTCLSSSGADADGLVSKSRDMGASWLMCGFALHGWLFRRPWQVRLVSRKAEFVDARSPDSLFWKIDWILDRLPVWMTPAAYDPNEHRMKMKIINPANGNQIGGESTGTNAVRGGRATWVGFDEAAFVQDFGEMWDSTANSTYHRFAVSSESFKRGPDFYHVRKGVDRPRVPAIAELDWWVHPLHDRTWFDEMRQRMDGEQFAQEVLRDPHAAVSTWVYPMAMQKTVDRYEYVSGYPIYVGIDPGFADETAVIWAYDNLITGDFVVLDAYINSRQQADYYGTIMAGQHENGPWTYDERALEILNWIKSTGVKPQYFGDTYGDQVNGASLDSFYSRLRRFGIHVNVDRMPSGQISAYQAEARFHQGRRQALRELLPRMAFANTSGAQLVLKALQEHRFRDDDKPTQHEAKTPLHDWTSHPVTALEFIAVNLRMRRSAASRVMTKTVGLPKKVALPRNAVRLGQRPTARWSAR